MKKNRLVIFSAAILAVVFSAAAAYIFFYFLSGNFGGIINNRPSRTEEYSPSPAFTPTLSPSPYITPSPSPTPTPEPTITPTPSAENTAEPTPTISPVPTPDPTPTPFSPPTPKPVEIERGNKNKKQLSLTFTIFWGNDVIPDLLDTLDECGVKATFFIGGSWADNYPELLSEITSRGHEIGLHGYNHVASSTLSRDELKNNILKCSDTIYRITGKKTDLFSPPGGDVNEEVLETVSSVYFKTITWSIDTIDWRDSDVNLITDRVNSAICPGGIILMHPKPWTVQALPLIIEKAQSRGYTFVTVSECIA